MINNEEAPFFYISIGLAILLPLGILKYFIRERYATSVVQQPEVKQRILGYTKRLVPMLRIFLWLSPLLLILLPWLISEDTGLNGAVAIFACMVLVVANVFVEYRYRKWLYQYLEKSDPV